MIHRSLRVSLAFLISGMLLWAGREYHAGPGERVVSGEYIVAMRPGVQAANVVSNFVAGAQNIPLRLPNTYLVRLPPGIPANVVSQIAAHFNVDFLEPNRIRQTTLASPNDPMTSQQYALQVMQAAQAWGVIPGQYLTAATAGTNRIKVAVLDTGVDCTHPDFKNSGGASANSALGGQILFSSSQALVATTIQSPTCTYQDDQGHGTHVSGIVAASTNNGVGISSLGYTVQIISYKVLDSNGSGSDSTISNAIIAATDAGAKVISLSLGGTGYSPSLQSAVDYAWQHDSLVVAAAGNNGLNQIFFPAGANFAVSVAASDSNNNRASFSNFGNAIDIAAPGVSILSTLPTYSTPIGGVNYGFLSGTSMATPYVSALAGLLATLSPNSSSASILQRIQQTASSTVVNGGWSQLLGFGVINAYNAVTGTLRPSTLGSLVGQIIDANGNVVDGAQVLVNGISVTTAVNGGGLYRIQPLPVGTYTVSVSAAGFTTQNLTATIAPGADTVLPVRMGVSYGKFTGVVTDAGVPAAGAIVQALGIPAGQTAKVILATAVTDAAGNYTLWVSPGGTYDLRVSALSRATSTVTGQFVAAGSTLNVNLTIAKFGTISGVVRDASTAQPIANVQILISGTNFTSGASTDANGNYSSTGLPAGLYTVTCSANGYPNSVTNNVLVSADTVTPLDVQMSLAAGAWYNAAWGFRKALTINHAQVSGTAALTNFPVLVSVTDANLQASAQASGNDILFTAGDGVTKLAHEIEKYSSVNGNLVAWVQVPSVSPVSDTVLYLYYGNAVAADQQNRTGVWDSNYKGVWHLPNGTTLTANDSTVNANHGIISGSVSAATGQIGGGETMTSPAQNARISTTASIGAGPFTVSAWANTSGGTANGDLIGDSNYSRMLAFFNNGYLFYGQPALNMPSPATGGWHHYVYLKTSSSSGTLYVDGVAVGTNSADSYTYGNLIIGNLPAPVTESLFGSIDEVRLSNAARTADTIKTEFNNQSSPATFIAVGPQQTNP